MNVECVSRKSVHLSKTGSKKGIFQDIGESSDLSIEHVAHSSLTVLRQLLSSLEQDKGRAQAIGVDFSEAQAILSAFIGEAQSQHVRVGSTLACRIRQARVSSIRQAKV
eukprot:1193033-Prorocentrum_minimum.AAC.4